MSCPPASGEDAVEAGVVRVDRKRIAEHDPRTHGTVPFRPVLDLLPHVVGTRIERLDEAESPRVPCPHFECIARVVAIHAVRRDQERAVHADLVHGRHHVVAGDFVGAVQEAEPRASGAVPLVGVNLGIDDWRVRHGCSAVRWSR